MRFLGIDYGEKRVGVALSDETETLAFPRSVFSNNKKLLSFLLDIIAEEEVSAMVIGESRDYHGKENPLMKHMTAFKEALERETGLPVFFEPEFLSSHQAASSRSTLRGLNEHLDASAAAIILQAYLDRKKHTDSI